MPVPPTPAPPLSAPDPSGPAPADQDPAAQTPPALCVRGLSKTYGRVRAVRDVSLTIGEGQLFGLMGPNGCGKTTTLACALGLLRPDPGTHTLEILGGPAASIHRRAGRVAAVFDTADLVPGLTARANLRYAQMLLGHEGGRSLTEALQLVGLADLAGRRAGAMSLGQKRRLSIARALLGQPRLLVFDEPLSGLDAVGVNQMLELFARLRDEGATVVLSSHRLHEMERIVTHVGVLADGEVLASGSLADLLASSQGRVRLTATPLDRARDLLAALPGVTLVAAGAGDERADEIVVQATAIAPAALNRALLDGGCEVSALRPERATLAAVFSSLLARKDRGEAASGVAGS